MHQAKITKTDQKVQPKKTEITSAVTVAAAAPQTCALLDFCSCNLCVPNELWHLIFILLSPGSLGRLLFMEAKDSI